jgi:hypothetical protein
VGAYAMLAPASAGSRNSLPFRDDGFSANVRRSFTDVDGEPHQPELIGRAEAMAKRFRHEGLPVARLWENHSAFISVGLNGKGRPGIWLVQKTH